jgi:hypothetical protein
MIGFITHAQLDLIRAGDSTFNFDSAMPQDLYNAITEATGQNPCGHVVFVYQKGLVGGYPLATSNAGARMLTEFLQTS